MLPKLESGRAEWIEWIDNRGHIQPWTRLLGHAKCCGIQIQVFAGLTYAGFRLLNDFNYSHSPPRISQTGHGTHCTENVQRSHACSGLLIKCVL